MSNFRMPRIGERVFVYRNLHRNCLSVKSLETKRVIAHVHSINLKDVTMRVTPSGQARVRREKQKNVHAGIVGYVIPPGEAKKYKKENKWVTYDPYLNDTFVDADGTPVFSSNVAIVDKHGASI